MSKRKLSSSKRCGPKPRSIPIRIRSKS